MDHLEAARRRAILTALSLARAYQLPLRALRDMLDDIGHVASTDRLRTDCTWLAEQGLVRAGVADVWMLTDRGLDVVMGRADAPGVQRPEPGQLDMLKSALAGAGVSLAKALNGG